MLLAGETLIPAWRNVGRVLWVALCASFCFLARAFKTFAETGRVSAKRIVHGGQTWLSFAVLKVQLGVAQWSRADRVEVQFRGSKGDQLRKGAVISRVWVGSSRPVGAGGGAVDLMLELVSCYSFLPSSAPLVAYGSGGGSCSMWTKQQASVALREVVALAAVRADKFP